MKIVIIEPCTMMGEAFVKCVAANENMNIVTSFRTIKDALEYLKSNLVDIIVSDFFNQEKGVEKILSFLKRENRAEKLILLSEQCDGEYIQKLQSPNTTENSIYGYVWKNSSFGVFENAITIVKNGDRYLDENVIAAYKEKVEEEMFRMTAQLEQNQTKRVITLEYIMSTTGLSAREVQVLKLIAQGKLNKEIGYDLSISEKTVKNHISSIFRKIEVGDRTQAALYAVKHEIVSL